MRRPFAALLSVLSLIAGLTALAPTAADADTPLAFGAAADSVVNASVPDTNIGGVLSWLDARAASERHIYMRFTVTGVPAGDDIESASLRLAHTDPSTGTVTVNSTPHSWAENPITWNNKPASGALRATKTLAPGSAVATDFDVTSEVTGNGDASFLLKTTLQNVLTIGARENGTASLRPQLLVKTKTPVLHWGSSVEIRRAGEPRREAMLRIEQTMGAITPRIFGRNSLAWPAGLEPLDGRSMVWSFKRPAQEVLAGTDDAAFRAFIADADTYLDANPQAEAFWSYSHEPEDNIAAGAFPAQQYRDAFTRLIPISREVNTPRLVSTLILMKYSLQPGSGRTFSDYFPPSVDVLGFDTYKWDPNTRIASMVDPIIAVANAHGKPWAIAETGVSVKHTSAQRQTALHDLAAYIATRTPKPRFALYFNSDPGGPSEWNWPIDDEPTMANAWNSGQDGT